MKYIQYILQSLLYTLLLFGIYAASSLSSNQYIYGNICPSITFIPACYIILGCFCSLLLLQVLHIQKVFFYITAFVPLSIALYGTYFQIFGSVQCPKTGAGVPMCFLSLAMFISIILCKYFISRK